MEIDQTDKEEYNSRVGAPCPACLSPYWRFVFDPKSSKIQVSCFKCSHSGPFADSLQEAEALFLDGDWN